jgi:anti-anti-sigma factor
MSISKDISPDGEHLTISIQGRFDFNIYKEFRDAYEGCIHSIKKFTINMAQTEYLDSSALGMLLVLREQAGADNSDIEIVGANSEINNIFNISNFDKMFNIK